MASHVRLTDAVSVGGSVELTWSLDDARDVHRMLCHVRSMLARRNVPNRVTLNVDARKVFAMATLPVSADAWHVGRTVASTFA